MHLRVECYSGYKADERPLRFYLGDRRYEVQEVLDQWYAPSATYFRVKANDGGEYILRHNLQENEDAWMLESFRR